MPLWNMSKCTFQGQQQNSTNLFVINILFCFLQMKAEVIEVENEWKKVAVFVYSNLVLL